ncbi:MAG: GNAT family N-acetyltransferase [Mobilitalea sp.]
MYIETNRLIIRELMEQDANALIAIKNDKEVMKYHPTFFENATIDFIKDVIFYFQYNAENGVKYPEHGYLPAVCLKDSGEVIGVITLNQKQVPNEWHIGWYFMSRYTSKGYASEAGAAASDYFLEALSLDYISAGVRVDNPASFRTAQKSGFKLIEKRIPYDYNDKNNNSNGFNDVVDYFSNIQCEVENGNYYYFQKFSNSNKNE